jgi:N-acetylmuramoyl-L-alanine amidase
VVELEQSTPEAFAKSTGQQDAGKWLRNPQDSFLGPKTTLRIAIDPGHGGVDPGAVRQGVMEKDIALQFSKELAEVIENLTDYDVVMTRDADVSVSLGDRVRIAREAQADIFLSIHTNTVTEGDAYGASVYTLSERASDASSAKLAELENRADVAVGLTGHVETDDVARVLVDLSRVDTNVRSRIFAAKLIENLHESVGVLRSKPHRSAGFRVLKAHDIPSVLLELGFISNARDLKNMQNNVWREQAARAVVAAIEGWVFEDNERSKLVLK